MRNPFGLPSVTTESQEPFQEVADPAEHLAAPNLHFHEPVLV